MARLVSFTNDQLGLLPISLNPYPQTLNPKPCPSTLNPNNGTSIFKHTHIVCIVLHSAILVQLLTGAGLRQVVQGQGGWQGCNFKALAHTCQEITNFSNLVLPKVPFWCSYL